MLAIVTSACGKTTYVPVTTNISDSLASVIAKQVIHITKDAEYVGKTIISRDTVIIRDSVVMTINQAGEVIQKEVIRERERSHVYDEQMEHLRQQLDSLLELDSVRNEQIKNSNSQTLLPVEKSLSWWEQALIFIGTLFIVVFLLYVIVLIVRSRLKT